MGEPVTSGVKMLSLCGGCAIRCVPRLWLIETGASGCKDVGQELVGMG